MFGVGRNDITSYSLASYKDIVAALPFECKVKKAPMTHQDGTLFTRAFALF